jgi:hypothetical protein
MMGCDGYVTAGMPTGEECDGCDGFFRKKVDNRKRGIAKKPQNNSRINVKSGSSFQRQ